MNSKYENLINLSKKLECEIFENKPLKKYTSFKIGGNADIFIIPENETQLKNIISLINKENLPFFILGKGSNLLISDEGYKGVILNLGSGFKKIKKEGNTLICGAGVPLAKACVFAMNNSLSGLEFAWGIPGSCGGALFMNAGAYGNDISDIVTEATHITKSGEIKTLRKDEMRLSYRKSIYSENSLVITSVKMALTPAKSEDIRSKMYEIIDRRKSKQPLNYPSAGSIFKRPVGYYAGALIQQAGLKGFTVGGAMVSEKHSGFIVNKGGATAKDVCELIKIIKEKVYETSGVKLECEVKTLGDLKI